MHTPRRILALLNGGIGAIGFACLAVAAADESLRAAAARQSAAPVESRPLSAESLPPPLSLRERAIQQGTLERQLDLRAFDDIFATTLRGPGPDACGSAMPISGLGAFPFDISLATTDGPPTLCGQIENDVWLAWTAACSGTVTLETCGAQRDTRLAVYACSCAGDLTGDCNVNESDLGVLLQNWQAGPGGDLNGDNLTNESDLGILLQSWLCEFCPTQANSELACNDDAVGCGSGLQSRLQFSAVDGSRYLVRVGGAAGPASGAGMLNIACGGVSSCQNPTQADAFLSDGVQSVAAEDFRPAQAGQIARLSWWGTSALGPWRVRYLSNFGGLPAVLLADFSGAALTVTAQATGGNILGAPEFEFSATHAPVAVVGGACTWVEITNQSGQAWFWESSASGNGRSLIDGQLGFLDGYSRDDAVSNDLALCVDIATASSSGCDLCEIACSGTPENEPCLVGGGGLNNGCNGAPQLFQPISCGSTLCGNLWASGGQRDSDWYLVTLAAPGSIGLTLRSELPAWAAVFTPSCAPLQLVSGGSFVNVAICGSGSVNTPVLAAGPYWVVVSTGTLSSGLFSGYPCGSTNDYALTVTCDP